MNPLRRLATAALLLPLATGAVQAQDDKAKKQAEIRAAAQTALEKFYAARPSLKNDVAKAPGYGVFTTYGLSFMIGGAGGKGVVHDATAKKDVFMDMAQASAGVQIGASQSDTLIVFKTKKGMADFIEKGWVAGASGGGTAGAGGKSVGGTTGQNLNDAMYYTITKNGLQAGGAVEGTKFWKDKSLN
jgi:lipid-binding SYLF domain-containing protein